MSDEKATQTTGSYEPLPGYESFRQTEVYERIFLPNYTADTTVLSMESQRALSSKTKPETVIKFIAAQEGLTQCLNYMDNAVDTMRDLTRNFSIEEFHNYLLLQITKLTSFLDGGEGEGLDSLDLPVLFGLSAGSLIKYIHDEFVKSAKQFSLPLNQDIAKKISEVKDVITSKNIMSANFEVLDIFSHAARDNGLTLRSISKFPLPLSMENIAKIDEYFAYDELNQGMQRMDVLACLYYAFTESGGITKVERLRRDKLKLPYDGDLIGQFMHVMHAYVLAHIEKAADSFYQTGVVSDDPAFEQSFIPEIFAVLRIFALHAGDTSAPLPLIEKMVLDRGAFANIPAGMRALYEAELSIELDKMEGEYPGIVDGYENGDAAQVMQHFMTLYKSEDEVMYEIETKQFFENFEGIRESIARKPKKEIFCVIEGNAGIAKIVVKAVGKYLVAVITNEDDHSFILEMNSEGSIWGAPEQSIDATTVDQLKKILIHTISSDLPRAPRNNRNAVIPRKAAAPKPVAPSFTIDVTGIEDPIILAKVTRMAQNGLRGIELIAPYSLIHTLHERIIVDWSDPQNGKIVYIDSNRPKMEK